ncbi:MAG: hypothetical protein LRY37_03555 [Alkalibacterium thalassium]|nr:hypothetical protein [Alkalibacterium thalassium]
MQEEHTLREQLETNYPEELRRATLVRACFGGEFHFDTMNLVEKMIIRKVAKVKQMFLKSEKRQSVRSPIR